MARCDERDAFLERWARCEVVEDTEEPPLCGRTLVRPAPEDSSAAGHGASCRPRALRTRTAAAGLFCGAALALAALGARGPPRHRRDGVRAGRAGAARGALVQEEAVPPAVQHACPGSVDVRGFGNASVVAAQFHSPGVPGAEVKLDRAAGAIEPSMRGKAYFASRCATDSFDPTAYVSWKLLGKRLRYHTHFQGAGCGCNAALYLVGMPQNAASAGTCNDYFCDAHSICDVACSQIVVQDANQHAWSSSLHVSGDPDGAAIGYGGGASYNGPRDWTDVQYSPTGVIATAAPVEVVVSFPMDANGALKAVEVALLQDWGGRALTASITSYRLQDHRDGLKEMTASLEAGLTPVINYYSSSALSWLDGRGLDGKGPCAEELPADCAGSVRFFNFSIEDISGEATPSGSTVPSTLTTTKVTTTTRTITRTPPPVARTTTTTTTQAPFDCLANLSTFEEDWFMAKALWCCRTMQLGCIRSGQTANATTGADGTGTTLAAAPTSTAADPAAATTPTSAALASAEPGSTTADRAAAAATLTSAAPTSTEPGSTTADPAEGSATTSAAPTSTDVWEFPAVELAPEADVGNRRPHLVHLLEAEPLRAPEEGAAPAGEGATGIFRSGSPGGSSADVEDTVSDEVHVVEEELAVR